MTFPIWSSWAKRATLAALLASGPLLATSCRSATQITLNVSTNVPCEADSSWQGVAVYVGKPGADVEQTSPTLVTRSCDANGNVGSLVVVPSDEKDGEVGLRVVAGVGVNPEDCQGPAYEGCIVARRAVRFNPHETLELDVELTADCVSVGCDPEHTCQTGRCVESRDVDPTPQPQPEPPVISGPGVHCGSNGARCAAKDDPSSEVDVCCLTVDIEKQTTHGECLPPWECPVTSIILNCDDDTDCPGDPGNYPRVCAVSYHHPPDGSAWLPDQIYLSDCRYAVHNSIGGQTMGAGIALCQEKKACANGSAACTRSGGNPANPLPGYFWCELSVP